MFTGHLYGKKFALKDCVGDSEFVVSTASWVFRMGGIVFRCGEDKGRVISTVADLCVIHSLIKSKSFLSLAIHLQDPAFVFP